MNWSVHVFVRSVGELRGVVVLPLLSVVCLQIRLHISLIPVVAFVVRILMIVLVASLLVWRSSGGVKVSISKASVEVTLYAPVIVRRHLS